MPKPVEATSPQPVPEVIPQPRKQSKITIIPSQPKSEKTSKNTASSSKVSTTIKSGENGNATETASQRPQLERQVRVERSRSRADKSQPISKSESTTGKNFI